MVRRKDLAALLAIAAAMKILSFTGNASLKMAAKVSTS
jgi:hypothetical protein